MNVVWGNTEKSTRILADLAEHAGDVESIARDESFWFQVQQAFTVDRSLINFNNGGVSPSPAIVQRAMKEHLDFSNHAPAYTMWRILEPQREQVRSRLARFFAVDREEIALTRNASEGLQICQFGMKLEDGDEILTTTQDYPRMINTWKQREQREGIKLTQIQIPVVSEEPETIVSLFENAITPRTRVILLCHVINLTGQILPVRNVVRMARKRGIPVIVDGAHSFAHFDFDHSDLDCDYYATSLHKWLFAPHGTGLLYVRRDRIRDLWPMMAANDEQVDDIRKFEEIGTHPAANYLAIAEALTFNLGIGLARKAARLHYLKTYWAEQLLEIGRVRILTSLDPRFSCAIATLQIDGIESPELVKYLWSEHRILTAGILHPEFEGVRISPSVYSTIEEIDRFCDVMRRIATHGLPS